MARRATAEHLGAEQPRIDRAVQARDAGDWRLARRRWRLLVRRAPHAWFWLEIATCEGELGRLPEALVAARHAVRLAPRWALAQLQLGNLLLQAGRPRLAERALRRAIARKPMPEAYVFLGAALDRTGRRPEARRAYRAALRVDPSYEEAHYNLGAMDLADQRPASAVPHLRRAIALDPHYQLALADLGAALMKDAPTEAAGYLRRAVALAPSDHWSLIRLGIHAWTGDRLDAADRWYARALRARPELAIVHASYGDFLASTGRDVERGLALVRHALILDPRDPVARRRLRMLVPVGRGRRPTPPGGARRGPR